MASYVSYSVHRTVHRIRTQFIATEQSIGTVHTRAAIEWDVAVALPHSGVVPGALTADAGARRFHPFIAWHLADKAPRQADTPLDPQPAFEDRTSSLLYVPYHDFTHRLAQSHRLVHIIRTDIGTARRRVSYVVTDIPWGTAYGGCSATM